jgi:hypothetical protein
MWLFENAFAVIQAQFDRQKLGEAEQVKAIDEALKKG